MVNDKYRIPWIWINVQKVYFMESYSKMSYHDVVHLRKKDVWLTWNERAGQLAIVDVASVWR